jgi:hypothetical protein
VARSLLRFVYRTGVRHLPEGKNALQYTRRHLDRLNLCHDLAYLVWGSKTFKRHRRAAPSPDGVED